MSLSRSEEECNPKSDFREADVAAFLRTLLEDICGIPQRSITDTSSLGDDLQIESAQLAQIQVALEDRFDVSLDFLELLRLREFSRIVEHILELANRPPKDG